MAPQSQTPVARVELRRASLLDIVRGDDVLRTCALLRSLPREILQALLEQGTARRFGDQAGVFQQGDAGSGLFLVLKGEARLVAHERGEAVEFSSARKGEVFGEAELFSAGATRGCSVVALGELDVVELPKRAVMALGREHPSVLELLRALDAQRRVARAEMSEFMGRW